MQLYRDYFQKVENTKSMKKLTLDMMPQNILAKLDFETMFMASRLIIAAEHFQVFRKIQHRKFQYAEIEKMVKIHPKYLRIFLDALVSLGLLQKDGDTYWNSELAQKYFIDERSIYWTRQFSLECRETFASMTLLEDVLLSGKQQHETAGIKKESYLDAMKNNPQRAHDFTMMLYYYHQEEAAALAESLDLQPYNAVLDIGGGSGVMSFALVKKNPHLRACVMDIEPVCQNTNELIQMVGLSERMKTCSGDFTKALPTGYDVIMCCDIGSISGHLIRMVYDSLPANGMFVIVDRFVSEDGTEPLENLLYYFVGASFGLETRKDILASLTVYGFQELNSRTIIQDTWLITAKRK